MDQGSKKWARTSLYGGKITENAVQGIARDVLCEGLKGLSLLAWLMLVIHIHDEIVGEVESKMDEKTVIETVRKIMTKTPEWANGLVLKCDIFTAAFYRKSKD